MGEPQPATGQPEIAGLLPSSHAGPAPDSISQAVGEIFFLIWLFLVFLILWWLLLPLAQDFLASAQGELALNGKCNQIHCKLAVKLTEGRWSF